MKDAIRILDRLEHLELGWKINRLAAIQHVGALMRKQRAQRQLSVRELARRMNVTAPYLSDMERGHRLYSRKWVELATAKMKQP